MKKHMTLTQIKQVLKAYDGPALTFMEVCGTHTASICENGIHAMLSPKIRLVSGPGCPVCVTVSAYIDRLAALSLEKDTCVVSFGDMLRVPGLKGTLRDAQTAGGHVKMVYSPMETLALAKSEPQTTFVFAAVGFETTTPVYAVLLDEAIRQNIQNIRLLTALKRMPPVIDTLCKGENRVDGFIAPGHVAAITGADTFRPLASRYQIPFAVSGFRGEEILAAIYALVKTAGSAEVTNLYPSVVHKQPNEKAHAVVAKYFEPANAPWRGFGVIPDSGLLLRPAYMQYDAGSAAVIQDAAEKQGCICAQIVTGMKTPADCPLFGKSCTPEQAKGACMVSGEGACFHHFIAAGQGL